MSQHHDNNTPSSWVEEARRECRESRRVLGPVLVRAALASGTTSMLTVLDRGASRD